MKRDKSTIGEAREQSDESCGWNIGSNYYVRAAMYHITGRLLYKDEHDIVLGDAAWIADGTRFYNLLKDGIVTEVEPFVDPVIISRGAIIDATRWNHPLPREQK